MKATIIFLFLAAMGCQAQHLSGNKLPGQRPADFRLSYHVDGGMRYYSEGLLVTTDSCVYDLNEEGKITHRVFKMDATALDQLYTMLRNHHFDAIKASVEGRVYDRGGISIQASWARGGQQIAVSDAGDSFVDKRWETDWDTICSYVAGLASNK